MMSHESGSFFKKAQDPRYSDISLYALRMQPLVPSPALREITSRELRSSANLNNCRSISVPQDSRSQPARQTGYRRSDRQMDRYIDRDRQIAPVEQERKQKSGFRSQDLSASCIWFVFMCLIIFLQQSPNLNPFNKQNKQTYLHCVRIIYLLTTSALQTHSLFVWR